MPVVAHRAASRPLSSPRLQSQTAGPSAPLRPPSRARPQSSPHPTKLDRQLGASDGGKGLAVTVSSTEELLPRKPASPPLHKKANRYTSKPGEAVLMMNKETMELELKQIRSFNREVYESRVRQCYLEERVTRALYTQKQSMRRHEMRASQIRRQAERLRNEQGMRTPFHQRKKADAAAQALQSEVRRAGLPVFSDIAAIEARLKAANLKARGVGEGSAIAKPATPHELALRVVIPSSESLLNPRNQVTSPLPDKASLLPYPPSPKSKAAPGASAAANALGAAAALKTLPELFDAKRQADYDAERSGAPRPSTLAAVKAYLAERHGPERAREKIGSLRYACALHAHVPRVALFQGMAGWGADGTPWDATKCGAALLLMLWLQPPPDEALKVSRRFLGGESDDPEPTDVELKLSDARLVLTHLRRKRLVSEEGVGVLAAEAEKLVLPQLPPPAPQRDEPSVSVDQLLLRWMDTWGSWTWSEDTAVLSSVLSAFGGGKKSPAKWPSAKK